MSEKTISYPLGHSSHESKRLDEQAKLLEESSLGVLVSLTKDCLEIGCGVGSNLSALAKANPSLRYTGIDQGGGALAEAKAKAQALSLSSAFLQADAHELPFEDGCFDMVFSKLVLWSVGPRWEEVVKEAHRVLKPGGTLYLFEPDDRFLLFFPPREKFQAVISCWQKLRFAAGLDPFIGGKLHGALVRTGLTEIQVHPFSKVSSGTDSDGYRLHLDNLRGIFMGKGAQSLGLDPTGELWQAAEKETQKISVEDFLVETHFIAIGRKKGGGPNENNDS